MLPTFTRVTSIRSQLNKKHIEILTSEMSPVFGQIDRHVQFEGRKGQLHRHDEPVDDVAMTVMSAEFTHRRAPLSEFSIGVHIGKLKEIAAQLARGFSQTLFSTMDEVTAKTGNVVSARGKAIDGDLILQTLDKMDHSFDADGTWKPPMMVAGSQVLEALSSGGLSLEFNRKLETIISRKRDEFRHREADRVLVG